VKRTAIYALVVGVLAGILIGFPLASRAEAGDCRVVNILKQAGFRGEPLRIAYAVVMRESKGMNLDERSPWYTGALGIFQIQTSAHSNKPWWSRSAMLNPQRQARIVYLHMTNRGKYWRPWGLTPNGKGVDARDFGRWSSWQITNWIWLPYKKHYDSFPRRCA
jgi:hypothetical protein